MDGSNPEKNMESIINVIQAAISHVFPLKKLSKKETKAALNPWITKKLENDDKLLDKLYSEHIKNGLVNSEEHIRYKKSRNKLNRHS